MQHKHLIVVERPGGTSVRMTCDGLGAVAAHGLVDIDATGQVFAWYGGSAGAQIRRANYLQLQDAMLAAGYVSADELAEELRALEDPSTRLLSPVMWSVRGRRPDPARRPPDLSPYRGVAETLV